MRIGDWSSDVAASDLVGSAPAAFGRALGLPRRDIEPSERGGGAGDRLTSGDDFADQLLEMFLFRRQRAPAGFSDAGGFLVQVKRIEADRKSVGWGKRESVRVDPGGCRYMKKKK